MDSNVSLCHTFTQWNSVAGGSSLKTVRVIETNVFIDRYLFLCSDHNRCLICKCCTIDACTATWADCLCWCKAKLFLYFCRRSWLLVGPRRKVGAQSAADAESMGSDWDREISALWKRSADISEWEHFFCCFLHNYSDSGHSPLPSGYWVFGTPTRRVWAV